MSKKKIIWEASEFVYPTREERIEAVSKYPKLTTFGFENINEIESFMNKRPMASVKTKKDLFEWDTCLGNKLGKLNETYIYLVTHYNRGIPEKLDNITNKESINSFLFGYYSEIFCYHYFSSRDCIFQIVNTFYGLSLKEYEVSFQKLKNLEIDGDVVQLIRDFNEETRELNNIRNEFTHRFPPNYPDYRPEIHVTDENYSTLYSVGAGNYLKPALIVLKMDIGLKTLQKFIEALKVKFNES